MSDLKIQLPLGLISSVRDQRAVLFLGAGASLEARSRARKKPPTGDDLRDMICDRFFEGEYKTYDLASASEFAVDAHGSIVVYEFIRQVFEPFLPTRAHLHIPKFKWAAIATTNYDQLIERSYEAVKDKLQQPVTFVADSDPIEERLKAATNPVQIIKLHGCLSRISDTSVPPILSTTTYDNHLTNRRRLFGRLEEKSYENAFVFCGYRIGDQHIRKLTTEILSNGSTRPTSYLVCPGVTEIEKTHWRQHKVEVIDAKFGEFMDALSEEIPEAFRALSIKRNETHSAIHDHFLPGVVETDHLRGLLDGGLTHVTRDMECSEQSAKDFYSGFDTGWGCIKNNLTVPRGVVEDVLLRVIEKEDDLQTPMLYALKGPAGNGKTVALKQLGWELSTSLSKLVVYIDEISSFSMNAIKELHEISGKRVFVLIDKASLYIQEISNAIKAFKTSKLPITFIATESDADWNNYCSQINGLLNEEFRVRYLSRREIEQLLDLLNQHQCLGELQGLSREQQILRLEEGAERQLLVALHEATHGKRFEDIVVDEFASLPETAAKLYLDICTLNQFGVGARAGTISRISGISFKDYEENFFKPLESIVAVRRDKLTGDNAYFARHSRVANLVFRGICNEDSKRLQQLLRMVRSLDVGYASDRIAFERLSRGHALIKSFAKAEEIRNLFKAISELSPEAFVLQQWAIFESSHKDGDIEIARENIEEALNIEPHNPTIQHTDAEVFRKAANQAPSHTAAQAYRKLARERLDDIKNGKNKYVLATRAKLIIDELESFAGIDSEANSDLVLDKTKSLELLLTEAQKLYPDDAEFHLCEAKIQKIFRDKRAARAALEKAYKVGAGKKSVPTRLARAYLDEGNRDKALATLLDSMEQNPDDKRIRFELGKLLLSEDVVNLPEVSRHLAKSYDTVDADYEARFWHAMVLFRLQDYEPAFQMFSAIDRDAHPDFRRFPTPSPNLVEKTNPPFSGIVVYKQESFLFAKVNGIPENIYCNEKSTDIRVWDQISEGSRITFSVRFSRRGPVGHEIRVG